MPEHRDGTPPAFRELESFLWHDFGDGLAGWLAWLRRRSHLAGEAALVSFADAKRLHAALRTLQAANADPARLATDGMSAHGTLNRLTAQTGIHPFIDAGGIVALTASDAGDPVALLLIEALEAMRLGVWRRFKLCRETTCRASFYDVSKGAGKVWCDMATCGSRDKMRRYRARN